MDPTPLIPAPDAIPVHWLWLQLPLTITTFLHLVLMNVLLGGAMVALVLSLQGDVPRPRRDDILRALPFVMAFTINFGVAPLLFVQALYGQFFYPSAILMGRYWLAIVLLLLAAYAILYFMSLRQDDLSRGPLPLGLVLVLLLGVAFLFTNNVSLMQRPSDWGAYFAQRRGTLLSWQDAALLPRYLHFVLSGLAVGGLAIALWAEFRRRQGATNEEVWIARGCRWFTVATLANFGVGVWFLGAVPLSAHDPSTGTGVLFFVLLLGSVFGTVKALVHAQRQGVLPAAVWTLAVILLMTVARDLLRLGGLAPQFRPGHLPVAAQYGPLLVFLLMLIVAILLIRWMLATIWGAREVRS